MILEALLIWVTLSFVGGSVEKSQDVKIKRIALKQQIKLNESHGYTEYYVDHNGRVIGKVIDHD